MLVNLHGKEEEQRLLDEVIFSSKEWIELDNGTLEVDTAIEIFKSKLPDNLKGIVSEIMKKWPNYLAVQENMIEVIKKLKKHEYKTFILSNAPISIEEYLVTSELLQYFDGRVISALEKVSKPKKEIYEILLNKYDLIAEECLFIDDKAENVDAAIRVGMSGHIHNMRDFDNLYKTFEEKNIKYF